MGYRTYTCPIARECGGCEWLAVPYPIQLRRKAEAFAGLFAGMAEADGCEIGAIRGMDEPLRYRHKAATPFAPGRGRRVRSGFYRAGSHRIVPCEDCLVEREGCRTILNDVARIAEELGISAYAEDRGRGLLRHAIVRRAWRGDDCLLAVVTNGEHMARPREFVERMGELHPELGSIVQNVNVRRTNAMLGRDSVPLAGDGTMRDGLLGCTFEIGATSFYQTNPAQTEVLYGTALELAGLEGGMRLLDAYCGTGTIGLAAARATDGLEVVGVERGGEAVSCARRNAELNDLASRARFVCADATEWIARSRGAERFDVVLLDPPRAGSTREFLRAASELAPGRIVYVSCNPETQERDVAFLRELGWRLTGLVPVDMFPHTRHTESVASLVRR